MFGVVRLVVMELYQIVVPHNKALKLHYHIQKKVWMLYLYICHGPSVCGWCGVVCVCVVCSVCVVCVCSM